MKRCWIPYVVAAAAAAAKSLQSCPTLCDPIDSSPPGSPVPGILQAKTLEWVAISSNAWKWKVKVKLLSRVRLLATPRKLQIKAKRDTLIDTLLEWPEPKQTNKQTNKTLTMPNTDKGEKWCGHLGDSLVVFYKTEHSLSIWSSSHTAWYLPKGTENSCPHKHLHTGVHSSFIHDCQNLEANNTSFHRWMAKQTVVYPHNEILVSGKQK